MLCQVRIDKFDTKRESGVSPERSGHCKQGAKLQKSLHLECEKAQPSEDLRARKPAEKVSEQLPKKVCIHKMTEQDQFISIYTRDELYL